MKKLINQLRNPQVIKTGLTIFICLLVFGGTLFYLKSKDRVKIENSLVAAPVIPVAPQLPGKLTDIYVSDGQRVKRGDILAAVGSEFLRAYSNGIIIETSKQIGALVNAQTPPVKMINPSDIRISGTVDENKGLNQIKVGQIVSFTIDALPGKTFWGYVDEVAETAKQTQLSFSISSERPTQQFEVFARFDAAAYPEIKSGMSAKMTVYTKTP